MNHVKKLDLAKHRRWQGIIGAAARSGMSIREFCRQRHLQESQFYWWQRRLKERPGSGRLNRRGIPAASFALVSDEPDALSAGIELVLANGRRLRISRGVDEASLRTVLRAMEAAPLDCARNKPC